MVLILCLNLAPQYFVFLYTFPTGIPAVSGNLILSLVFALVNGTVHIICVFTVLEPELWMNLVKSAFMMWPTFIKMAPPTSTRN